jgi:hypothetical protein
LRQTQYHTADLRCSDHRPVYAKFDCIIDVVDVALKDNLRRLLYEEKQRDALSDTINLLDLDDEDSAPQGPIAPGLPPASSYRSKWWLDNGEQSGAASRVIHSAQLLIYIMTGVSAKAAVQPPKAGLVPNPQRKSNPFSMDDEPDWIPSPRGTDQGPEARVDRKPLPPPRRGTSGRSIDSLQSPGGDTAVAEKSPPAVPRKPVSLSSQATAGRISPATSSQARSATWQNSPSLSQSPDGRRGVSSAETGDLLGDASGETIGWKPLLPQR